DDPFGVDPSIAAKAIALSPRPTAGKSFEVKCPMCETVGYASPKVAGQSVRCSNPQCMVPVFTVKAPKKEEAPPPPPPKPKSLTTLYAIVGTVVFAAAGGTIWYLNSLQAPTTMPAPVLPPGVAGSRQLNPPMDDGAEVDVPGPADVQAPKAVVAGNDRAEALKEALSKSIETALQSPSIKKAYGRRMTAIAYGHVGDLAATKDQLEQLKKVSGQSPYEAIPPLALFGWRSRATGDAELAGTIAQLKQLTPTLPKRGRFATESAIAAAALMAASGDAKSARDLLAEHRAAHRVEQLSAVLQVVNLAGTFNVDTKLPGRAAGDWQGPLETGVTLMLCGQNRWDEAESWATQTTDAIARDEAVLAFAEVWGRKELASNPTADLARVHKLTSVLSPAGKVRHAARIASLQFDAKNVDAGKKLLLNATEGLQAIPATTASRLTNAKSVLDAKVLDGVPALQGARAAAEIARVQMGQKQAADAWKTISTGLRLLRGVGPGMIVVQSNNARQDGPQLESLKKDLKKQLNLQNEDQVRRELAKFRERLKDLDKGAKLRFRGEIDLLAQAIDMGLHVEAWKEILTLDGNSDENDREPLLSSALPPLAAYAFERAGDSAKAQSIRTEKAGRAQEAEASEALRVLPLVIEQLCERGDIVQAVAQVNAHIAESGEMQEDSLRIACQMVDAGKVESAMQFVHAIQLESLREDGLFQVAARAARLDRGNLVKAMLPKQMKVTDAAAVHAGLASGWGEADRAGSSAK
ncbi:MAG: hypothetical protein NT069_28545, partial [Planctomycetota bacterium]|nr:hypothetical protein [Planctomycetota bacterium]